VVFQREAGDAGVPAGALGHPASHQLPDMSRLVFDNLGTNVPEGIWLPGPDYDLRVVRPRLMISKLSALPIWPFLGFWLLHVTHMFRSRDHAVFVVTRDKVPVHYTAVVPKYFRFPFMGTDDLLLGSTWTDPRHRGRSIARSVVAEILRAHPDRRCWYLARVGNLASRSVASASGLRPIGRASRTMRFGLRILGAFRLSQKDE